jgi:hypothetical protein
VAKKDAKKTRCEQGGDEILPFEVGMKTGDSVAFTLFVCKANARTRVWIEQMPTGGPKLLADESGKSEIAFQLPTLPIGRFLLRWSVLTPSADWQTRTELAVNDTVRFRRRKTASGDNPVNMGVLVLEVA